MQEFGHFLLIYDNESFILNQDELMKNFCLRAKFPSQVAEKNFRVLDGNMKILIPDRFDFTRNDFTIHDCLELLQILALRLQ